MSLEPERLLGMARVNLLHGQFTECLAHPGLPVSINCALKKLGGVRLAGVLLLPCLGPQVVPALITRGLRVTEVGGS